uniref:Uncharacterized protein n=1 Tax=Eptatretus burgeri TaxID=7764 RepID=A0A8C4R418_EPTBU
MASSVLCGPKLSMCGIVLGIWGVIMLVLVGVFFYIHSAILLQNVPFESNLTNIHETYEKVAVNCFIGAAVYFVIAVFSGCQSCMNRHRSQYGRFGNNVQ